MNKSIVSKPWPEGCLESVDACPVCGDARRELMYSKLTDNVFNCAPGEWTMHKCKKCFSAYLDPRPSSESISLAYQHYFTHATSPDFSQLGFSAQVRRKVANGYRNYRYGTHDHPSSVFGYMVAMLMPSGRAVIDYGMRHLEKNHRDKSILDVGCGNGSFLVRAQSAGWNVFGVDFDVKAVEAACSLGLNVRLGGVEAIDPDREQFDIITLAHVIEHVHKPIEVLQACYNLLKPGGVLWLETPNINACGHGLYGRNWRGLEVPRHLVLFSWESMHEALVSVGFKQVETLPYRPVCKGMFLASEALSLGLDPYDDIRKLKSDFVGSAEDKEKKAATKREFISLRATKDR